MSLQTIQSITLYFQQGSSDKVYQASIAGNDADGYVVNFAYGRRGSTLNTGTKTQTPVMLPQATAIYTKLVAEKQRKGYTEGATAAPYVGGTEEERVTGLAPQLLNPVSEEEAARLLRDFRFGAQEKFDGKRIMLKVCDGLVVSSNRKGLTCGIPAEVAAAALRISAKVGSFVIDGEIVGTRFIAFDMLEHRAADMRESSYSARHQTLSILLDGVEPAITVAALALGDEKLRLFTQLQQDGKEGIVFKRLDAPARAGRPASGGDQFKFKFVESCSCRVSALNLKRSIRLQLLNTTTREWLEVGNVTIPANHEIPAVGAVVEIRYLYAYRGGSLYQPVYLGVRDDIEPEACTLSQLKYKAEAEAA